LKPRQDKDSSYHPLAKMIPRHAHLKIASERVWVRVPPPAPLHHWV